MLFIYQAIDQTGAPKNGSIDAVNVDVAISSLQRRGLVITSINEEGAGKFNMSMNIAWLERVSNKDVVILSRQLATLFEAQVSALRIFRLLGSEAENKVLRSKLNIIADDLQAGSSISIALSKHPKIFSEFYVSMVKSGEESGKLNETFSYLADYLDRTYELVSKAKGALIYPAFVIMTFITVMILMFTMVIPKISTILVESGQDIPIYTKIVLGISNFFVDYGFILAGVVIIGGFLLVRYIRTPTGKLSIVSS
jgi:type II secretory pathway component PulF